MTTTTPDVPYRTRSASHRDGATNNTDAMRHTLDEIRRVCHYEMSNLSLRQCWPMIANLIVATTFTDADRRGDAIERFTDDLVKTLGETRRHLNASNRWIADYNAREAEAREVEAKRAARPRRPPALIA